VTITQSDEEMRDQSKSNSMHFEGGSDSQSRPSERKGAAVDEQFADLSIPDRLQGMLKDSVVDLIVENK
jgi:hypothetical protein